MKWSWYVLVALVLAGCAPAATGEVTPTSPAPTRVSAATAMPTATLSPTPTLTPTPQDTVTPPAEPLDRFAQGRRLGRGVNLGNALEAPAEGEWGVVLEEAYFGLIAQAGFDTVRVPIRWSAHAAAEPPYAIDEAFLERVAWVIDQALARELNVVINMHHYDELFASPAEHEERFIAIWRQIVLRYRDRPSGLYYEPLNEPHDQLTPVRWNRLLAETVAAIRALDKVHTIVVGGAEWGGIDGLRQLEIPAGETNYVCSFHYYEPFPFTHQGAEWASDPLSLGVQWPGPPDVMLTPEPASLEVAWLKQWYQQYNELPSRSNPAGPRAIERDLDWVARWGEQLDCVLWMGEFGAYGKADLQSRVNWTTTVRQEAEERGYAWAYWEFGAGFGVYDRDASRWREELLAALIPPD
ncbi:MAG: glycoside hydrolase family 5 protein [Anaerolineae bacterium]|nr:glycoside hydrolase family 5 protein [Anaerolineae bacterium]